MHYKLLNISVVAGVLFTFGALARVGDSSSSPLGDMPVAPNQTEGIGQYSKIVSRNVFALVAPPPAAEVAPTNDETLTAVRLTGFEKRNGRPTRAFFVSLPKNPNPTNVIYYSLREGERDGALELVKINERDETAEVIHDGVHQVAKLKDSEPPVTEAKHARPGFPFQRQR